MEKESTYFKQENGYGCGLYALANVFQDKSFITDKRIEESKNGNNTGQLNKWLLEHGKDLFLEPFYYNSTGKRLPKWVCGIKPFGEDVISIPILIDVQFSKKSKTHFIAAEITTNGTLFVIDSLKNEPYITTLSEFNKSYFRVYGVWHLSSYSEEGYFMRLK